jgi:hypothetical protein
LPKYVSQTIELALNTCKKITEWSKTFIPAIGVALNSAEPEDYIIQGVLLKKKESGSSRFLEETHEKK